MSPLLLVAVVGATSAVAIALLSTTTRRRRTGTVGAADPDAAESWLVRHAPRRSVPLLRTLDRQVAGGAGVAVSFVLVLLVALVSRLDPRQRQRPERLRPLGRGRCGVGCTERDRPLDGGPRTDHGSRRNPVPLRSSRACVRRRLRTVPQLERSTSPRSRARRCGAGEQRCEDPRRSRPSRHRATRRLVGRQFPERSLRSRGCRVGGHCVRPHSSERSAGAGDRGGGRDRRRRDGRDVALSSSECTG